MLFQQQNTNGLIILHKDGKPIIRKIDAYCVCVLLPTRIVKHDNSIILQEVPIHWERISSHGHTLRCHTQYEAEEARELLLSGVDEGQWLDVRIESYTPQKNDIPYHDWVRGVQNQQLESIGLSHDDLPESSDSSLAQISDKDWLSIGPR